MAFHYVETDDFNVRVQYDFPAHMVIDGTECIIHEKWPWDPLLHKQFGWSTVADVIDWWYANRADIRSNTGSSADYSDYCSALATYCCGADPREHNASALKGYVSRHTGENPTVRPALVVITRGEAGAPVSSNGFLLVPPVEEEVVVAKPEMNLFTYSQNVVQVKKPRGSEAPQGSDDWSRLLNYTFKMDPDRFNFFRTVKNEDSVMFGLELEVSTKLAPIELQHIVREVEPKQEPFFIMKQDGSITGAHEHKYEIVTIPCSPRYLRTQWRVLFNKLDKLTKAKGAEVKDYFDVSADLTNGLHVHVSKDHFRSAIHKRKFKAVFSQWDSSCAKVINAIAQRPQGFGKGSYDRIQESYTGRTLAWRLGKSLQEQRHGTCHELSGPTVEVRCFQGIFDFGHILRCLSFLEGVFEFSEQMSFKDFDRSFGPSFKRYINDKRKFAAVKEALACA